MSNIVNALRRFSQFFDPALELDDVEDLIDHLSNDPDAQTPFERLGVVRTALNHPEVLNHLLELSTDARLLHASTSLEAPPDSWEQFVQFIQPDHLLTYFTCLISLARLDPHNPVARRLALIGGQTFVLLQTVPGAKAFGAFHPPLIERSLQLLNLLGTLLRNDALRRDHERIDLLINCASLLDDVVRFLKVVALVEHDEIKKAVVRGFSTVVQLFYDGVNRSKYIFEVYEKSFGLLEHLCQTLHGDRWATMTIVLNGTMQLNRYTARYNAKLFATHHARPTFTSMSDWFVSMLAHYSEDTCKVLTLFVQAILTKASLSPGGTDALLANIDICVLFDSAMYRRCNVSAVPFLLELACSADAAHRMHCVEFVSRALLVDSECEWQLQHSEAIGECREIAMVRIILEKMMDVNNTVKTKAINGFLRVTSAGNVKTKQILKDLFFPSALPTNAIIASVALQSAQSSVRCDSPEPSTSTAIDQTKIKPEEDEDKITLFNENIGAENQTHTALDAQQIAAVKDIDSKTPAGDDLLDVAQLYEYREQLLLITRHNLTNHSALVRKAAIHLLEFVAMETRADLPPFLESQEMRLLHADSSPMVRRQLVLTLDQILTARPTDPFVIAAYVRLTLDLAADDDLRVQDTVLDSFKRNIFDNIQSVENTTADRHLFPWRLLRAMLIGKDTPDLRGCIGHWVHKKLLTSKILAHIETHIHSTHSTEAWILLSMVASKISSRNPERVVVELLRNLQHGTNHTDNPYMQLEVLACWLDDLNVTTLNEVFDIMSGLLESGGVVPRHVQRVYEICWRISQKRKSSDAQAQWAQRLAARCADYVQKHCKTLVIAGLCNAQLVSYIYVYGETLTDTTATVDTEVLAFFGTFLHSVINLMLRVSADPELPAKVNCVQSFLTKLALFNYEACLLTIPLIGKLLNSISENSIIITSIACLSDLYKKHTSLAQSVLPFILAKTRHKFPHIRSAALKNVVGLIVDEYIKFRGSTLMYIMAALRDHTVECSELAHEILLKYTVEKNAVFMRSCLLECPFVLNGYVYLDNLEMFADGDDVLQSPMKGAEHRADREYVYRFFVHNISVEHCYAYFGHLHMFMDKLTHETDTMTRPEGLAAVQDFLYVLTHICRAKEKSNRKVAAVAENGDADEEGDGDAVPVSGAANGVVVGAPSGRGRKGNVGLTVDQALHVVEKAIPRIAELNAKLHAIDPSLCSSIDDLCNEMTVHFAAHTEYAQPQSFWKKYRTKKIPPKPTKSRTVVPSHKHSAAMSPSSSSSSGEDDRPLRRRPSNSHDDPTPSTSFAANRSNISAESPPSQSESETDVERRVARLRRKRSNK